MFISSVLSLSSRSDLFVDLLHHLMTCLEGGLLGKEKGSENG